MAFLFLLAIHQDEDDALDDNQVKSPYGSSFRTFDGTDYSSIGEHAVVYVHYFHYSDISLDDVSLTSSWNLVFLKLLFV